MTADETAERICSLVQAYRTGRPLLLEAARAAGYFDRPNPVTHAALSAYLGRHPELISEWEGVSADQRTSEGWVLENNPVQPRVYFYPRGPSTTFPTSAEACAEFILRFLERLLRQN